MFIYPEDNIEWEMFSSAEYEQEVTEIFSSILSPGSTAFNIGRHVGYYTVLSARLVGSTGIVYCFEPMPHLFKRLEANVHLNLHDNVVMNNKALSSENGVFLIYPANKDNSGNSSIIQRVDTDDVPLEVTARRLMPILRIII